jgi:inhibitor of cysteine peptidase
MKRRRWSQVGVGATVCILLVALVAAVATGCSSAAASGGPLKLTNADNGKAYTVKAGDSIEVVIAGNPTTGYEWMANLSDEDAALLELVGEPAYQPDTTDEQVVGSGGTYTFTFEAAAAGEATLKLIYARSWEDVEPIETFEVTVTIE